MKFDKWLFLDVIILMIFGILMIYSASYIWADYKFGNSLHYVIYQGAFATMPPMLQMDKMPIRIIRPLCLIDEADIVAYAAQQNYQKQTKLCPFEHVSSRDKVKKLLADIKALNPEAMDCMYGALTNIKAAYLPQLKV